MKTVRALTGLQPNHVVLVDFDNFREVIDALGGVEIDVPKPILSNRFDCPYATEARCKQWQGWRFAKGEAGDERPARADLLARAARTGSTRPRTTSRAASASRQWSRR